MIERYSLFISFASAIIALVSFIFVLAWHRLEKKERLLNIGRLNRLEDASKSANIIWEPAPHDSGRHRAFYLVNSGSCAAKNLNISNADGTDCVEETSILPIPQIAPLQKHKFHVRSFNIQNLNVCVSYVDDRGFQEQSLTIQLLS